MQHETIRVGLVGVTGYTGMELASFRKRSTEELNDS